MIALFNPSSAVYNSQFRNAVINEKMAFEKELTDFSTFKCQLLEFQCDDVHFSSWVKDAPSQYASNGILISHVRSPVVTEKRSGTNLCRVILM